VVNVRVSYIVKNSVLSRVAKVSRVCEGLKAVMRGEEIIVNVDTKIFSKVVEWMGELFYFSINNFLKLFF